ncbi:hypothetical protein C8R47DRAFT_1299009 [Mycena vitilis]|nr:hypothetical protein C8R47DRAFT_1299009 [Mycena vitilis]
MACRAWLGLEDLKPEAKASSYLWGGLAWLDETMACFGWQMWTGLDAETQVAWVQLGTMYQRSPSGVSFRLGNGEQLTVMENGAASLLPVRETGRAPTISFSFTLPGIIPGGPEAESAIIVVRINKVEMTERALTPPSPTEILPNTEASPPFEPVGELGQPLQLLNTSNYLQYSQWDFKMPHRDQ